MFRLEVVGIVAVQFDDLPSFVLLEADTEAEQFLVGSIRQVQADKEHKTDQLAEQALAGIRQQVQVDKECKTDHKIVFTLRKDYPPYHRQVVNSY